MKKRKSEIKSAMSDPFDFLSGLRGGTSSTDTFNVDTLGKSAHKLIGSSFEEQELDIARTIREVVDSKILVPRDMKVDDSGIPVAANIVEWCTKERFSMINGERPYIEQIIWGIIAYNEFCPRCSDVEYLYHDHKVNDTYAKLEKKVAMLEHGVCPHCGWGRSKLVTKKRMKFIQELAVSAGQRSGKSMSIAGYFAPYLTHRLLKLQNPNAFYGLKTGTMLHCTFVALTYAQAKDTLWQNFYATLTESQWYQEYHSMLAYYSERYGEKLLKFNDTYVAYPSRGLLCYPAGPDKRVLRGRTRYFYCIGGNELINTDKGLVPMSSVQDGMVASIGSKSGSIRNHTMTGTKRVHRLSLVSGQELIATKEHKVVVYRNSKFKKVKLGCLTSDDKVCVGLGGVYPTDLVLPKYSVPSCLYDVIIDALIENSDKEIDHAILDTIIGDSGVTTKGRTAILSKLRKAGAIHRHYRKGAMYEGMNRCFFTVVNPKLLESFRTQTSSLKFPTRMTPELGEFIGMLLADGNLMNSRHRGIWFGSTHKDRVIRFHRLSYKLFGVKNHVTYMGESKKSNRKESWKSILCNKHVIGFLRTLGLDAVYSADKVIPWCILQAPRDVVLSCIKAMYMCDGHVNYGSIIYRTTSKSMALMLQQMLFREHAPTVIKEDFKYLTDIDKYGERDDTTLYSVRSDSFIGKILSQLLDIPLPVDVKPQKRYFELTKNPNIVLSNIKEIVDTKHKVPVYDMTVDHKRHAYQASGMLVSNSVDEVGWFDSNKDSNKVKDNAHEVVGALDRSLLTVRGAAERLLRAGYDDVYPGYGMNVSSPSHRNDMIMTLVRRSENSDTMYGVIRPTWEVNPTLPRNSSTLKEAFRTDPITAERDYGAMPPLASSPFLQNHTEIAACAKIKRNGITLRRTVIHKKKRGESFTYADVRKLRRGKNPTVMAIDAGLTDNSFSGVVGSMVDGVVKVHVVFDIIPDIGAPLNHTFIFNDVILPIIENWNVRVLYADRWNSVKLLQDAKDMVPTLEISAQHSLKYKEMFTTKTLIQQGILHLPKPESESVKDSLDFDADAYPSCFVDRPMDHLYLQLATVKDTGKMVDKGDGYTDDTFRALALLVWALHEEDVQVVLSMSDDLPNTSRPTAIAASKLYSGGGGAIGSGSSSGVQLGISSSRR